MYTILSVVTSRLKDSPRRRKTVAMALLAASLAACTGIPEGVTPVAGFELQRYLGTWYEIARLDHGFERGLTRVTATYTLREDGGVLVVNRGWREKDEAWDEAEGKAYFIGDSDIGRLKVSFFGPFYGAYNIIALDSDEYRWAMVAGPDTTYLWILSRTPELEPAVYDQLLAQAREAGFPVTDLIEVAH